MRATGVLLASVVVQIAGCGAGLDPLVETARQRAMFDFHCQRVDVESVGGHAFHASGCGRSAEYVCDGASIRGGGLDVRCSREAPMADTRGSGSTSAGVARAEEDNSALACVYGVGEHRLSMPDYGLGCASSPTAQEHNCTLPVAAVTVCQSAVGYRFAWPGTGCPAGSILAGTVRLTCDALTHPAHHACVGGPRGWEAVESGVSCRSRNMDDAPGDFAPDDADPMTFLGNSRPRPAPPAPMVPPPTMDAGAQHGSAVVAGLDAGPASDGSSPSVDADVRDVSAAVRRHDHHHR